MATTETKPKRLGVVTLKNVRLSFAHLFEPTASKEDGPLKYRASFLMDPETPHGKANIKLIETELDKAFAVIFKDLPKAKADKLRDKLDDDRKCLRDGDDATNKQGDVYSGYEGMMYIGATNGRKPKVLRRDKSVIDSSEAAEIYSGCYVNGVVSIWATDKDKHGGLGAFATLEIVQYLSKGEPFGAAELDEDDYLEAMDDEEEEEDSLV